MQVHPTHVGLNRYLQFRQVDVVFVGHVRGAEPRTRHNLNYFRSRFQSSVNQPSRREIAVGSPKWQDVRHVKNTQELQSLKLKNIRIFKNNIFASMQLAIVRRGKDISWFGIVYNPII